MSGTWLRGGEPAWYAQGPSLIQNAEDNNTNKFILLH